MKTSALRWTLVFACLFAFSVACGDSSGNNGNGGDAGTGGPGGTGGSGGSGGAGGSGGSSEPPPGCGDGKLDPGEECDDGNNFDNDGCSADCRIEGTCETPYNYRQLSNYNSAVGQRLIEDVTADWMVVEDSNSCATGARSVVFRYKNGENRGRFQVGAIAPEGMAAVLSIAVRKDCADPESEIPGLCRLADGFLTEDFVVLEPEEEVYVVVDIHESVPGGDPEDNATPKFVLGTAFMAVKGDGDACVIEPKLSDPVCDEGLACGEELVCRPDEPPVVSQTSRIYRDDLDDRIIFMIDGTDTPGNTWAMQVVFLDEVGNELGFDGYDDPDFQLIFPDKDIMGKMSFTAEWIKHGFNLPQAAKARINFIDLIYVPNVPNADQFIVPGEEVEIPILPIPEIAEDGACDFRRVVNRCMEGLECRNIRGTHKCVPEGS